MTAGFTSLDHEGPAIHRSFRHDDYLPVITHRFADVSPHVVLGRNKVSQLFRRGFAGQPLVPESRIKFLDGPFDHVDMESVGKRLEPDEGRQHPPARAGYRYRTRIVVAATGAASLIESPS
jgi:hypothetical protein